MKPRIRRIMGGLWVCRDFEVTGFGLSPQAAWENWDRQQRKRAQQSAWARDVSQWDTPRNWHAMVAR